MATAIMSSRVMFGVDKSISSPFRGNLEAGHCAKRVRVHANADHRPFIFDFSERLVVQ